MGAELNCRLVVVGPVSASQIGALARSLEVELRKVPRVLIGGTWEGAGISLEQSGAPRPARVTFTQPVDVLSIGRRFLRVCAEAPVTIVPERGNDVVVEMRI